MYKQFIKYALIGGASLVIDFIIYYSLTRFISFFHNKLIVAKAVSFFISSVFNFNFNKKWTFGKKSPHNLKEIAKYYSVAFSALGINALLMFIFLKFLPDLLAWFFAAAITALLNFVASRLWVFANEKSKS